MSDVEQGFTNGDALEEEQVPAEKLEEVAGGARREIVCPKCGQSDMISKDVRHGSLMFFCKRCNVRL